MLIIRRPKSRALEKEWLLAVSEPQRGTLLSVDCEDEATSSLCVDANVDTFPSLNLFKDGKYVTTYRGSRHASGQVFRLNQPF